MMSVGKISSNIQARLRFADLPDKISRVVGQFVPHFPRGTVVEIFLFKFAAGQHNDTPGANGRRASGVIGRVADNDDRIGFAGLYQSGSSARSP